MKTKRDPVLKLAERLLHLRPGYVLFDVSRKVRRSLVQREGEVFVFAQRCAYSDRPWFRGSAGELVRWLVQGGHVRL